MPWILHMSDPHLGDVAPNQRLDDEKEILEAQPDLETTQTVFKRTLRWLVPFVKEHGKPDVVVVSGDISYRAEPSGFAAFAALLEERADVLPDDRKRIVVVPGNHDVVWGTEPGSSERYEGFIGATRGKDCCTPLLDGIDFDKESGELLPGHADSPHVVATDELLVVPLNSSNWCGTTVTRRWAMTEEEWREALEPAGHERDRLLQELARLRLHDIARVSRPQIEALGRYVEATGLPRNRAEDGRIRVAVLHHQLLPVSTREERKAFESLMNLGLVRATVAEYGFDVVLHGHKHESGLYWDLVGEGNGLDAEQRRVLVVSSPGHFDVGEPVMRAILLEGSRAARNARVITFAGLSAQNRAAQPDSGQLVPLWSADQDRREQTTIVGPTAHATYSRLRSVFALRDGAEMRNVVCQVASPADAQTLPPDYPELVVESPQAWFDALVAWWQLERSELVARGLMGFNHGERIRRRWGDQIERATRILNRREESSRALVQLVAPRETGRYKEDDRDLLRGSFPAFVLAEFSVTVRDGARRLDCFGYFRKQEMQYWWPVNLAELAQLQEAVRADVRPAVSTGRIVTFSAIALWKHALPRVAVPIVDLLVEERGRLLAMAVAVTFPGTAPADAVADWRHVLLDLAGSGRDAPPKVSAGVAVLLDDVQRLAAGSGTTLEPIVAALEDLRNEYAAHADREELPEPAAKNVGRKVAALTAAVTAVLPEAAS